MRMGKVCAFALLATLRFLAASTSETEDDIRHGRLLQSQGRLTEARQKYQDALTKSSRAPEQAELQVSALWNLANVEVDLGNLETAARIYNQAIGALQATGNDIAKIEILRMQLAEVYLEGGDAMTADRLIHQVIAGQNARGSPKTPEGAVALDVLSCVYVGQKKLREAELSERQALAILEAPGPKRDREYGTVMLHLGSILNMRKRPADALPFLEDALATLHALPLRQPDMEGAAQMALAHAYSLTGRTAEALSAAEEAGRTVRNYYGPEHYQTAVTLLEEAEVLRRIGEKAAARSAQVEGNRIMGEIRGPGLTATIPADALLARPVVR